MRSGSSPTSCSPSTALERHGERKRFARILLRGLEDDACQAPHWGYMLAGQVVVTYTDDTEEICSDNDLFYWPPGHSVRVVDDAEVILFSPQVGHAQVLDHMLAQMATG